MYIKYNYQSILVFEIFIKKFCLLILSIYIPFEYIHIRDNIKYDYYTYYTLRWPTFKMYFILIIILF